MDDRKLRLQALYDALENRILVLDGAMGSILHSKLTVADYGGAHLENCTDNVCRTRPDLISEIHRAYLDAGAEIIETNSFNGHPISLSEFGLEANTDEINRAAARIAREAADAYWSDDEAPLCGRIHRADHALDHRYPQRHLSENSETASGIRRKL